MCGDSDGRGQAAFQTKTVAYPHSRRINKLVDEDLDTLKEYDSLADKLQDRISGEDR